MRVLLVSNSEQTRCGISLYGKRQYQAMKGLGVDITDWSALYPKYLPPDVEEYDLVHFNFHPHTINHIQAQHLPKRPRLSGLFHEARPDWLRDENRAFLPSLWYAIEMKMASEDVEGCRTFYTPVPDVNPEEWRFRFWDAEGGVTNPPIMIGNSSIRRDGMDWVEQAVIDHNRDAPANHHWAISYSPSSEDGWLSDQEEVDRLGLCDVLIAHYHSGYLGQSAGAATMLAARRPLIINSGPMVRTLWKYAEGPNPQLYKIEDAEEAINTVLEDLRHGRARYPLRLAEERSWTNQAKLMLSWWEELCQG